ncbi:hypothetical protein EK904_010629 [Melospiza melodia maxima]|nr:hypothetical protein EK904_010629 [Melospiza melodia maxima]
MIWIQDKLLMNVGLDGPMLSRGYEPEPHLLNESDGHWQGSMNEVASALSFMARVSAPVGFSGSLKRTLIIIKYKYNAVYRWAMQMDVPSKTAGLKLALLERC